MEARRKAVQECRPGEFEKMTKELRKSKKLDRREHIIKTISHELDARDRWMGIRQLKKEFTPQPYHRKDKDGKHVPRHQIAEESAQYLANKQWGRPEEVFTDFPTDKIVTQSKTYNTQDITLEEIKTVLKKCKRRKAPGPDEMPMEIILEMTDSNLENIARIMNAWWAEEIIPAEVLQARIVLIFKKGDTSIMENYRPISLLNSIYKLFAAIVHRRLEEILDEDLQKMQFGFRRHRSTADAIQCIRNIAEHGERTHTKTIMVLLDWEKAFDKVTREGLFSAMDRMHIDPKLQRVIQALYSDPMFKVELDGQESGWKKQETGIRQGCPLSPYLFLIVMTVLFHDIHREDKQKMLRHRIPGINFDEVLYADDTICASTDTAAMNRLLAAIETEGKKYGMKLNKSKCEVMHNANNANVHFQDGTPVPRKDEVKYLGCHLNENCDMKRELNTRISTCMSILTKLDLFWKHSSCPTRFKLQVLDAVIKTKLLYGMESAQLNEPQLQRLDVFQLKGLRKILHMKTTYVERGNTNENVYKMANEQLKRDGGKKEIVKFSTTYKNAKIERFRKLLAADPNSLIRQSTMTNSSEAWNYGNKRVGRPKIKWVEDAAQMFWNRIRGYQQPEFRNMDYDRTNLRQRTLMITESKNTTQT